MPGYGQETAAETVATTEVPLKEQPPSAEQPEATEVDERVRFGVSLPNLEMRTADALVEVLWSHAATGADAVEGLGFSIRETGEELVITVLPRVVLDNGGTEMLDELQVDVRNADSTWPGELLLLDKATGVGILRVGVLADNRDSAGAAPSPIVERFRATKRLSLHREERLGTATVVFGYDSLGEKKSCVAGRLAGRDAKYLGESLPTSLYRVRMHLRDGRAGGPLLDDSGSVVALLTDRVLEASDEHHAVPLPVLRRMMRDLVNGQRTGVAWIGATFHSESSTPQIVAVRADSPAAQAGLREGDVVVSIGGEDVGTLDELADAFYYLSAGQETQIEVLRGLEKLDYSLVPAFLSDREVAGGADTSDQPASGSGDPAAAAVRARR